MTTPGVSYGTPSAGAQSAYYSGRPYCPPGAYPGAFTNGFNTYSPRGRYCPPAFGGAYSPVATELRTQGYETSRERDYYKSKLYRHEESTGSRDKGGLLGLAGGGALGMLAGFLLPGGPLLWGTLGAIGGGLFGAFFGKKLGNADALARDADDQSKQWLDGSPAEDHYQPPVYPYPTSPYARTTH